METGHDEDEVGSRLDDLVLVVDVEPGPAFRIAEIGGRSVARGEVSRDGATGITLGPFVDTTERTMRHLRRAWETREPHRYVADRPEGRYDVYVAPLAGTAGEDRLLVHLVGRPASAERRRNIVNAAIVDALPGSVALIDPDGVIRAVNAGWVRFGLERSHDGLLADAGTSYLEVTDRAAADDATARAAAEAIRSVLAGDVDLATCDYPSDGSSHGEWFTMRVASVEIDDERWAVISHEDVTSLHHALDRWHSTFSNAVVPTIIVDRHGDIVDANGAFAELVGVDLPTTIGRPTLDFVHPDHHPEVRTRMRRAQAGEPITTSREMKLIRSDGSTVIVMMHPSMTTPGRRRGSVMQLIDVTQQRRVEARLALHRELLELVAAGTPLGKVATAVATNIGRVIDGAVGAVLLIGAAPFAAPGVDAGWRTGQSAWRVPIDHARPALGAIVISSTSARRQPDDDDAAGMLASVLRLALQRDEARGISVESALRFPGEELAFFGPSMRGPSDDERASDDLRRALDAGEITVHYQPIIDLATGATVSLEALIRWEHPTRGFVAPPELILVAEASGLIEEVGALVLATACADLAAWHAAGNPELSVAVNLAASQLADPHLVALVREATEASGLEASALVVEITESVVVDDADLVASALAELRALGVRVAIDDFGTGYSSLLYLKRFPADVLKVDRSFVQGLGVHDGDTAIVEAIVGLGHRLGLAIVAEGVETDAQLTELRRRHCDRAQGYLLHRPMPAREVRAFLDSGPVDLGPEPPSVPMTQLDVDQLLSLVGHELSTPLTVIGGHAELLADLLRSDDESPRAVVDALERNIRNLDELLTSLTGLSHALGARAETTALELGSFVAQAIDDLGPLLAEHEVRTSGLAQPIHVDAEPVALRQILTNLLGNAVKFTEPGTLIEVAVRSRQHHEVIVTDHGRGVPEARATELFGRYARLGARARGLGLGLHLSRALARRQGGDLLHEHTPGGGATFVLRIPR